MKKFCHIVPVPHLRMVKDRPIHLTLAHLIENNEIGTEYTKFYREEKDRYNSTIIMDNSAFEMFKQGKDMYPSDKLITMAQEINADYIVMSDYPGEDKMRTIEAALTLGPIYKQNQFKTFFVPQGYVGSIRDLVDCWEWAANNPAVVDYIGMSILAAPLAFNVERDNKLQRFVSRLRLMYTLKEKGILDRIKKNGQKIHFLGMVDGPNEIIYMNPFKKYIDSWDSSAGPWYGLNYIEFDNTPTGSLNGKFEEEVNFKLYRYNKYAQQLATSNMEYIDNLIERYLI